jgi:hypothetical protein
VHSDILLSVADQLMERAEVDVRGKKFRVKRTGHNRLRSLIFNIDGHEYQAIEQNPDKPSRWGKIAREGHRVVQFRDIALNKYIAVSIDGKLKEYGKLPKRRSKE